jgi:hypothetical protein
MPQPPSNNKPAVFSVVIRSVDHDITENDVKEELDSLELKIDRMRRVIPTPSTPYSSVVGTGTWINNLSDL